MKRFIIDPSFFELFPQAEIGILIAGNIDNTIQDEEKYAPWLRECEKLAARYYPAEVWTENPVVRTWRDAFSKFKTKKGARCSIEALLKRVSNGNEIGCINPLVDLYNGISLKYGMPAGGENSDCFDGDLHLKIAAGGESFITYGSDKEEPALPGEVIYADGTGAVCRCWNWRESVRTMLTEDVKNAILVIEQTDNTRHEELCAALDELAGLMQAELGATVEKTILNRENPTVQIEA
ncbi:MAG: B3/4 domain-containing protein [Clostridia bacterium]|nr:B3/4 domain-containing protein [Clostridia bacterium]